MGVLEALGGWQNVNQEKLEQIKVDNPPLYSAISKALNLLAKKFGGEDIIIQKPIEVVDKKPTTIRKESDYAFLKRMEILTLTKVNAVTSNNIVRSIMDEVGLEDDISLLNNFISYVQEKLDDLEAKDLVSRVAGSIYTITNAGQELINSYELQNKQVEEIGPSDEDLKLEMLLRMANYYDGGDYKLLSQDDLTTNAVKHQFDIPRNKFFGIVVKLLQDRFVETDPSGDTDSIRLTNRGYDEAMDWIEENFSYQGEFEVNPNEEEVEDTTSISQYNLPQHRMEGILKQLSEVISKTHDYVTISELYRQLYDVIVPITYTEYGLSGEPTLEKDLQVMEGMGLVKSQTNTFGREYYIDTKGSELLTQLKFEEAQKQKASSLRPSPSESATMYPVGTKRFGNDGNEWRVTMTKSGVQRWTKVGEIPSDEPEVSQEPPISEITEDEVDLDLLEQQLNDDSLEFDLNEEDLDNLEF